MPSVINSARTSTASVFDTVTTAANVLNNSLGAAALGIDALNAKAQLMHTRVTVNAKAQSVIVIDDEATKAATEHTDLMEDIHKRNYPDKPFDRAAFFETALKKIQVAIEAA